MTYSYLYCGFTTPEGTGRRLDLFVFFLKNRLKKFTFENQIEP